MAQRQAEAASRLRASRHRAEALGDSIRSEFSRAQLARSTPP